MKLTVLTTASLMLSFVALSGVALAAEEPPATEDCCTPTCSGLLMFNCWHCHSWISTCFLCIVYTGPVVFTGGPFPGHPFNAPTSCSHL